MEAEEETVEKARGWTFDLIFNGSVFVILFVIAIGSIIMSGRASDVPWYGWIVGILVMSFGVGFLYFGILKLRRVRELTDERD